MNKNEKNIKVLENGKVVMMSINEIEEIKDNYKMNHVIKNVINKEDLSMNLLFTDKDNLKYVNKTEDIIIEGIKRNIIFLNDLKEQTPEICLEAVKQNGLSLLYVKEQTPKICLAAVKQNGYVLGFVKEQTPEICLAAVKKNMNSIIYVTDEAIRNKIVKELNL